MNKLRIGLALLFCSVTTFAFAQNNEEEAIKKTINQLFDGMRKSDSTLVRSAFNQGAILQTIGKTKEGTAVVRSTDLNGFVASIAKPHPEIHDERIVFTKILIDANLASVWTDYKFYIGEKFSHCGVNSFQLVKVGDAWKIVYLIDTRRKENCN
ncbi:MAG: nuclear transport factor 2 family protein [Pedobacter sp.]|uniref:nuclear transport factor 2 family protein n=1 Tax=Pedobacter sp. TaxID=1411316 RepID=UPI002806A9FF|nr:nuclear transport factor 2 family protein [Pedobacter sp.]MDQ8003718.1 nuclear transport factor 2 family protein [Pedobacter sp.]